MRTTELPYLFAALTCLSCAGTPKLLGAPVRKPIALLFSATPELAARLDPAALAVTMAHLKEGLKDRGVQSYAPKGDVAAPPPRIEFLVKHWTGKVDVGREASSRDLWWVPPVPPIAAEAVHDHDVEIDCTVLREGDTKPSFQHTFAGHSGKNVVDQILTRVFTDRTNDNGVDPIWPERHY